jgi:hypothetical protein
MNFKSVLALLFNSKWQLLDKESIKDLKYPGVYLLANPAARDLARLVGKTVKLGDVDYVGMSNNGHGVGRRLHQFLRAIEGKGAHSAGNRVFAAGYRPDKKFLFVAHPIVCCSSKANATPDDFRKMGNVACLEYYAIAHILEQTGAVPSLNVSAGSNLGLADEH